MPLVRCPKHGRVYDNSKERGCPLCLKGAAATEGVKPAAKLSRAAVVNIIALVVVLAGGAVAYVVFLKPPPPPPPPQPVVIDTLALLDPGELYTEPDDPKPVFQARFYAATLQRLYADRATLLGFSEGPVDTAATDRASRRRAQAWGLFVTRWQGRLALAKPDTQYFYRPGVRFAEQLESINNFLGAARSAMRLIAPADRVPARAERQRQLEATRGYLNSARTLLSELPETQAPRRPTRPAARRR